MIGYPNDVKYAFEYAEIRNFNVESSRKMFKVMLLGNDEDSQSSLMRSFLGKSLKEKMGDIVCGTIDQSNQILESKYLIFLKNPDLSNLEDCDIACIIFDGSLESINYLKESVIPFLPQKVPRLLILNKKDNQDHENVYAFSLELGLREYAQVNFAKRCPDSLFKQIRDIVQYPFKGSMRKETVGGNYNGSSSVALWFLLGVGFASSAVYIGKKLTQSSLLRF